MQPQQLEDEYSIFEDQAEMGAAPSSMATGAPIMPEQNPEEIADDFSGIFSDDNGDTY
jgi:hypothetical protein